MCQIVGGWGVLGLSIPIGKWDGELRDLLQHFELSYSAVLQIVTCRLPAGGVRSWAS